MRWVRAVLPLAALSLFGAAPVPKHLMPKDEPFWPTAVGTKWEFDQKEFTFTEEITKAEPIKGGVRLTVRVRLKGEWDDTYDVGPAGVTQHTCASWTVDTRVLQFPIRSGDTWAFSVPIQKGLVCDGGTVTVGGGEEVKVPAGTFQATKVVTVVTAVDGQPLAKPTTHIDWYAKGVGLVRREWDGGGRVLKSFKLGKK